MLERLFTTPMTAAGFILGYLLPIFPMALAQTVALLSDSAGAGTGLELAVFRRPFWRRFRPRLCLSR